jgi:acetyltransferase-like isoleucine patch superfamily enzyme
MTLPILKRAGIRDVRFGAGVTVVEPVNLYECEIGEGCFVGPFVEIQRGVVIGARSKIQSHSFVCELVTIGEDCVVAHGVKFVNDLFATGRPAGGDRSLWRHTRIGDRVSIGSGAVVLPVTICSDVVIGAGAVVTRPIDRPGIYAGNPAKFLRAVPGFENQSSE